MMIAYLQKLKQQGLKPQDDNVENVACNKQTNPIVTKKTKILPQKTSSAPSMASKSAPKSMAPSSSSMPQNEIATQPLVPISSLLSTITSAPSIVPSSMGSLSNVPSMGSSSNVPYMPQNQIATKPLVPTSSLLSTVTSKPIYMASVSAATSMPATSMQKRLASKPLAPTQESSINIKGKYCSHIQENT